MAYAQISIIYMRIYIYIIFKCFLLFRSFSVGRIVLFLYPSQIIEFVPSNSESTVLFPGRSATRLYYIGWQRRRRENDSSSKIKRVRFSGTERNVLGLSVGIELYNVYKKKINTKLQADERKPTMIRLDQIVSIGTF